MIKRRKMLVTTTSILEGWKIEYYLGTISSHVVAGSGFFSDFFASLSDVFGGRSESYQKQLVAITDDVIEKLKEKAIALGANAIVGLRIDHDEISGKDKQMFMVTAMGTAVKALCLREGQHEDANDQGALNQDDFSSLVRRRQIIRSGQEGTLILTDGIWNFLIENQVHELAPIIARTVELHYNKSYSEDNDKWFINRSKEYFYSLPENIAKMHLYDLLTRKDKVHKFAFELIGKLDLLDIDQISELLKSFDFEIKKRALQLLEFDKPYYTATDIRAFQSLIPIIESAFQPKGERITEKALLSSKTKDFWKCECGTKIEANQPYCYECLQDIYGFKENEIKPQQAITLISDRIAVLEDVFSNRDV